MKILAPIRENFFIGITKYTMSTVWIQFFNDLVRLGGKYTKTIKIITTYTILTTDHIIFCDTDGGAFTVTLPIGVEGQEFKIINCGSNTLTVSPNGSEELFGGGAGVATDLSSDETITIHFNITKGWF